MKNRNVHLELLRMLCMLMVLLLHYFLHGEVLHNFISVSTFNQIIIVIVESVCIIAVNVFVFISSYFLSKKKDTKRNIIKTYIELWVTNFFISVLLILYKQIDFSLSIIFKIFFPFLAQNYWFIDAYLLLLFFIPYLSKMLGVFNKRDLQKLIALLFLVNSIFSMIPYTTVGLNTANSLVWFMNLFIIVYYIKEYNIKFSQQKLRIVIITCIAILSCFVYLLLKVKGLNATMFILRYNNPIILVYSLAIFMLFMNSNFIKKEFPKKSILFFSTTSLYVYLITENPFFRDFLWNNIFNTSFLLESNLYILFVVLNCLIIYILCIFVGKFLNLIVKYIDKKVFTKVVIR